MIAAAQYANWGINLFGRKVQRNRLSNKKNRNKLKIMLDFSPIMTHHHWCKIKAIVPIIMEGTDRENDAWWKVRGFVDGFNKTCQYKLFISKIAVLDKSMPGFWPR